MSVESSPGSTEHATLRPNAIIIPILVVYMATCLSVPFYYRLEQPALFNALKRRLISCLV